MVACLLAWMQQFRKITQESSPWKGSSGKRPASFHEVSQDIRITDDQIDDAHSFYRQCPTACHCFARAVLWRILTVVRCACRARIITLVATTIASTSAFQLGAPMGMRASVVHYSGAQVRAMHTPTELRRLNSEYS